VFEVGVILPALAILIYAIAQNPRAFHTGLLLWMALIAAVDLLPVSTWHGIQMLLDFPLLMSVAMLYSPSTAAAALFIASFDSREFNRRVALIRALFNRSQVAASALAASATFHALGTVHDNAGQIVLSGLTAIAVGYLVNAGLVAIGASLLYRERLSTVVRRLRIGRPIEFLVSYLGLGLIGIVAAELYLKAGFWVVLFVMIPLVLARQTFFRSLALENARQQLAAAYETERQRAEDLERLDRRKAELSQILTHDFLHAAATLRTASTALLHKWEEIDEGERLQVIGWIERESNRLKDLAEHSIAIMQMDADGPMPSPRPEHVADLVKEAADATNGLDGRLKIYIGNDADGVVVQADRSRTLQVFRNLLINAAAYSEPGTPVDLEVVPRAGDVVFTVRDRGPGIAPEHLDRLFRRFSRLPGPLSESAPGSGLGLFISRQIVDAHGGRIWVESEPGKGSAFSFTLLRDEA